MFSASADVKQEFQHQIRQALQAAPLMADHNCVPMQIFMKISILLCALCQVSSFSLESPTQIRQTSSIRTRRTEPCRMAAWDDSDDENTRHNKLRMDVRNFLTQRAVQSFMFLLDSCRDPHTIRWLEETYGLDNLLQFHGSGAFDLLQFPEWDSLLADMTHQPSDVVVVSVRQGKGHGWSKNNPHIEERFVEVEIEIDPPALVNRIISVRDQISKEWVVDLDTLVTANEMILESYIQTSLDNRAEECETDDPTDDEEVSPDCAETDSLIAPYSDRKKTAYERNAMLFLSNTIATVDRGSSPQRKGNFDLLLVLATQESIHRVLRSYLEDQDRQVSFAWLRDFYVGRIATHFDGNLAYGRADDFLEELLLKAPSLKTTEDGMVEVIDPLRVAEDIIVARSQVAKDWKDIMLETHKDHMALQRMVLDVRMGKSIKQAEEQSESPSGAIVVDEEMVSHFFNSLDEAGAFE